MAKKNDENQEKKKRNFIFFSEVPFLLPLSALQTLQVEPEWVSIQAGSKIEERWFLVINKNMESSKEHPVGEVRINYGKREVCLEKINQIVNEIGFDNYNIITL